MKEEFPELERLVELSRRYPQLARAITADEPAIAAADARRTDRDLRFLTRVTDAPLMAEGYLTPDGVWRVLCFHIIVNCRDEAQDWARVEAAIAEDAEDEFFIPVDGVAEEIVRWCIPRLRARDQSSAERSAFEKRLAQSRFADGLVIH